MFTKEFWKDAADRAVVTVAQAAIASIGTAMIVEAVDWKFVASASALAGVLSLLTSVGFRGEKKTLTVD